MLSPDELRRLSEQSQQRIKQERVQKEEAEREEAGRRVQQKQAENDAMADSVIAKLPQRVEQAASQGLRSLTVIEIEDHELSYDPKQAHRDWYRAELEKVTGRFLGIGYGRASRDLDRREREYRYRPDCLPPHHRKIYDWCERAGFETEFRPSVCNRWSPYIFARITINW